MILRILAVGDVVGAPGLTFLTERLRAFREQEHIDFTVVNGENANVVGVTPKQADAIFAAGADVITLGNHTWTRYELQPYLEQKKRILRPANFAPQCPGRGWGEYSVRGGPICVINLMGRFTLDTNTDNPFLVVDDILEQTQAKIASACLGVTPTTLAFSPLTTVKSMCSCSLKARRCSLKNARPGAPTTSPTARIRRIIPVPPIRSEENLKAIIKVVYHRQQARSNPETAFACRAWLFAPRTYYPRSSRAAKGGKSMSRDSKMCAAQFAKGMGIGLGVGMAVGAAAGLMMQPQKKRANGIVADAVRTVSDVTDTIRDTMGW